MHPPGSIVCFYSSLPTRPFPNALKSSSPFPFTSRRQCVFMVHVCMYIYVSVYIWVYYFISIITYCLGYMNTARCSLCLVLILVWFISLNDGPQFHPLFYTTDVILTSSQRPANFSCI